MRQVVFITLKAFHQISRAMIRRKRNENSNNIMMTTECE